MSPPGRPLCAKNTFTPKWQVLSDISSTPACEKWHSTFASFRRAMVSSEMTISRNAENVLNTPCRPASKPNPAAAEKLPRSMTPPEQNTSGFSSRMFFNPVDPSRSESITKTASLRFSGGMLSNKPFTMFPNSARLLATSCVEPRYTSFGFVVSMLFR